MLKAGFNFLPLTILFAIGLSFPQGKAAPWPSTPIEHSVLQEASCSPDKLAGLWQFTHVIYRGETMPRPNPRLIMHFEFDGENSARLYWHREDENGFCESHSRYTYENCYLRKEVLWLNPESRADCKSDPDMTPGNRSISRLQFSESGQMKLYLPLGDETIVYLWNSLSESPGEPCGSKARH